MDREEVTKWLTIMKANLNSFPGINCGKKIEALAEAIRLLKNEQSKEPSGSEIPTSSDDCISRQAVLEIYDEWFATCNIADKKVSPKAKINALPPVTPTHKKGKWLGNKAYPICPKCNCNIIEEYISCSDFAEMYKPMKFCPNCGAEMEGEGE